jgi:hypothetical protein
MASKTKKDHIFTDEEKAFLRDNISRYTYPELATVFNQTFGTHLTHGNISDVCIKRLGLRRNKPYVFSIGKKDFTAHPVGTEVFDGKYVWVKVSDHYHEGSAMAKSLDENWEKKCVLVWEQAHGKIPKGHMIVFLDKDRKNCTLKNLYCTTRKINFMMAKNGWYSSSPELTLAALKWCELFYALKEERNDVKP